MEATFEKLRNWGCDVEGALERFLEDEELYMTCLHTVVEDAAFEQLGVSLGEKAVSEAFDYAHTLKGVFANLGLTPMYQIIEKIVEPLRAGCCEDLQGEYEKLLEANVYLKDVIGR